MSRKFAIHYPDEKGNDVTEILTESEIFDQYFHYWYQKMCEKYGIEGVSARYSWKDCLEDWIVVNWAVEVIENEN
jgi:hypothetical protein